MTNRRPPTPPPGTRVRRTGTHRADGPGTITGRAYQEGHWLIRVAWDADGAESWHPLCGNELTDAEDADA